MKKFNLYLAEKLKVNKNSYVEGKADFKAGDKFSFISIQINHTYTTNTVGIYNQKEVKEIEDDDGKIWVTYYDEAWKKNITSTFTVNSRGYLQQNKTSARGFVRIMLRPAEAMNIINYILKKDDYKYDSEKSQTEFFDMIRNEYIEDVDTVYREKYKIGYYNFAIGDSSGLIEKFRCKQDLKMFIDKYYAEYK